MSAAKYEQVAGVVAGLAGSRRKRLRLAALDRIVEIVEADLADVFRKIEPGGRQAEITHVGEAGPELLVAGHDALRDAAGRLGNLGDSEGHPGRPKDGRASAEAWRAYAESVGVDVPDKASKAEIIALVEAAEG